MAEFAPHDLTGNWSHLPWIVKASSEYSAANGACYVFDGTNTSGWMANGSPCWLQLDCGAGFRGILTSYQITAPYTAYVARAPKNWTLQGSNDGATWDTIDTINNQTGWTHLEQRTFAPAVQTTAYQWFRINVTANNESSGYTIIAELYLIGTEINARYADIGPHALTANSYPGGQWVASASSATAGNDAFHAFDATAANVSWQGSGAGVDHLTLDTGSGSLLRIKAYGIQSAYAASRAPKNWTFEASNDGSSWDTLDTQTNQTGWDYSRFECRMFLVSTITDYRYFRVNITASNGDASYTLIQEVYLYGTVTHYFHGSVVLPAESDVKSGVQYGANGTEFTGTLAGGSGGARGWAY